MLPVTPAPAPVLPVTPASCLLQPWPGAEAAARAAWWRLSPSTVSPAPHWSPSSPLVTQPQHPWVLLRRGTALVFFGGAAGVGAWPGLRMKLEVPVGARRCEVPMHRRLGCSGSPSGRTLRCSTSPAPRPAPATPRPHPHPRVSGHHTMPRRCLQPQTSSSLLRIVPSPSPAHPLNHLPSITASFAAGGCNAFTGSTGLGWDVSAELGGGGVSLTQGDSPQSCF